MRRLYYLTLGFFLFTVRAETDFQGHRTEKTQGTTVTKDLLLKKENTIGHGTEAIPTKNTHRNTAVAVTAKFPAVVLFDTRPTPSPERIQITKALAVIASPSTEQFVSRNGQNSLTTLRQTPTAMRIRTESEIPLISNYEKIVFSFTQAAFESMRNGTSEPEVHLSADAVKSSLWLHTLLDNRNQRNTDPFTPTSADGESGVPALSASHPRVIDNLPTLHNDNGDKRSRGKDEKGISSSRTNEYQLGTMQSIFQNDTAEDSLRGDTVTNLCLTCLKNRRAMSTKESVAQPALPLDGSSHSLSVKGLALDFSEFSFSLPSLQQQSAQEQGEKLDKNSTHQNIAKHFGFGVTEQQLSNMTFFPSSFNKTVVPSDMVTVTFGTQSQGEISSVTQKDTRRQLSHTYPGKSFVAERTAALNCSSKSFHMVRKPVTHGEREKFGEKENTGDPQPKLYFSNNKNASHSLSANLKNEFIQNQPLVVSSGSVSNMPVISESAHSGQKSVLPEGSDHSAASHSTARMRLIEAHSTVAPFSFGRQTTSAVKHPEFHSLTERTDSLISVLRSQTPAKSSSQTKEPILSLLPKDSAIKVTSVTTETHLTDKHISHRFNTLKSIVPQTVVDPSEPVNELFVKQPQTPTYTTRKTVVPVPMHLSESRQDFDYNVFPLKLTTLSSKSSSERLTISRFRGTQKSKITNSRDLTRESQTVHNLKLQDKDEQVLTVAAEHQDKEEIQTEGKQGEEIKDTKEIVKLHKEEESREDEKWENKREELLKSDKIQSGQQEKNISTGGEINHKTYREGERSEEHKAEMSREDDGGTAEEEDVTWKHDKDPKQEEVRDKESAKRKGVTRINRDVAAKQRESLTKKGAEARREETASKEDLKHTREIGKADVTNVPLGATTGSKELNGDKGHSVINPSSYHSLIKHLGATEQKGVHLGENTVEIKYKPFSYKVTSNQRQLHSTLKSQSPQLSRVPSLPKEPYTQIQPCLSTLGAMLKKHGDVSSRTTQRAKNKVFEATFFATAIPKKVSKHTSGVNASMLSDTLKPTISLHSNATKSAHPVLNSVSNMLSLTTLPLAIPAGFLGAQPHFTINSPTLSLSIIYTRANHRHKFTSVSKANSLLQTLQAKHIVPAPMFEPRVKDFLTSNMFENINMSTSVPPPPPQQMYNDSSNRSPTAEVLSSEAQVSIDRLQSHQGQSARQKSQSSSSSSSSDMTTGQRCSLKLSEQTVHSDAWHAPVDDNGLRSVETLMTSMSPKAKNAQFPLSNMSLLRNPMLFRGDSLPGTYNLTGITSLNLEKEMLRTSSEDEYANSGSVNAQSLLETADETIQTEENDTVQSIVIPVVEKQTDAVKKQTIENGDKKNSSSFIAQTIVRSKHPANSTDEFSSWPVIQTRKLAVKNANDNDHNNLFNVDGHDEANKTLASTLDNNRLSLLDSYNETSTKSTKSEQPINEDVLPVTNDFAASGRTAFVGSDNLPEILKMQANDVTNNAISDMEHHAAKTIERQHDPSTPQGAVGETTITGPRINFRSDLKVPNASTQQIDKQIMNATTTPKTNDFVSPAANINGAIVSTEAQKSALTTSESTQVLIEKAAHAESRTQTNSHIELLSLRDPAPGKYTLALKRKNATGTRKVEQPEHKVSVQALEQSHRSPPGNGGEDAPDTKPENGNCSTDCPVAGKATPKAANTDYSVLSPATSASDHHHATVDEYTTKNEKSTADETSTKTQRALVKRDHLERPETHEQAQFGEKRKQRHSHRETSEDQEVFATEVILSDPEATTPQTTVKSSEWTVHTERNTKTKSNRGVTQTGKFETENGTRLMHAPAKEEKADQESGHRLLLLLPESESELPRLKHRRRTSPHLYLSGVTEVSEDLCGSGNYTAEMSLNLGRGVKPGDAVPALGNLRVVINLKTNNSRINLEVTSCCLSPTIQPDVTNSTCCLFSRLAAEPAGITLLPSALSTSASFSISLFQMINYSVVYLHCDLSVCLRNRSDCERECLQQRSAFPLENPEAIVTNLRNRISFGPMLKEVENSTFLEAIDPSEPDLVLVIVSLVVGSSLVTVMLLLAWLAYRHRAIWPLRSAAPPQACCGSMHPGGDLILP